MKVVSQYSMIYNIVGAGKNEKGCLTQNYLFVSWVLYQEYPSDVLCFQTAAFLLNVTFSWQSGT